MNNTKITTKQIKYRKLATIFSIILFSAMIISAYLFNQSFNNYLTKIIIYLSMHTVIRLIILLPMIWTSADIISCILQWSNGNEVIGFNKNISGRLFFTILVFLVLYIVINIWASLSI